MAHHGVKMPVVVLERETGDLQPIETLDHLRMFVEEMYDYLEDDFAFWDSTGRTLGFERMFIQSDDDCGIAFGCDAAAELNDTMTRFLRTHPDTEYFHKLQAILQKLSN